MTLSEDLVLTTNAGEVQEKEITPQSLEAPIPEVSNEQLERHVETVNAEIDQQAVELISEAEQSIESSATSMSMSSDSLVAAKDEYGIDVQLQEVQSEADQIARETKKEVVSIVQETHPINTHEVDIQKRPFDPNDHTTLKLVEYDTYVQQREGVSATGTGLVDTGQKTEQITSEIVPTNVLTGQEDTDVETFESQRNNQSIHGAVPVHNEDTTELVHTPMSASVSDKEVLKNQMDEGVAEKILEINFAVFKMIDKVKPLLEWFDRSILETRRDHQGAFRSAEKIGGSDEFRRLLAASRRLTDNIKNIRKYTQQLEQADNTFATLEKYGVVVDRLIVDNEILLRGIIKESEDLSYRVSGHGRKVVDYYSGDDNVPDAVFLKRFYGCLGHIIEHGKVMRNTNKWLSQELEERLSARR